MNILLVGGGGREHALAWKMAQSEQVQKIYCAPGNPGTAQIASNLPIDPEDIDSLLKFAKENDIGLTVVGPEQPLALGIVDRFQAEGLRIFGPSKAAAELEGSKAFSKDLMKRYKIPTAAYETFDDLDQARKYAAGLTHPVAVKADGLAAGKGVLLCQNAKSAVEAVETLMQKKAFGDAGDRIIIEEFLVGHEVSVLAFADGTHVLPLDSAQDHKAVFDGDQGPNTGGMGAFSPAPILTEALREQVLQTILKPAISAMASEGRPFRGILYAGLMLTADGLKTLEFNARFGDPETQPLMMRLQSDLIPIFEACIDGTLDQCQVQWKPETAVCVVMASGGYPGSYEKGKAISGLDAVGALENVVAFHAGTKEQNGKIVTSGGRVLGVTALGANQESAINAAYKAVETIHWDDAHYRTDIGRREQ